MPKRIEIRLAGTGGQGLILAGIILAEAAILDGKNVVQSQSYGPEARGGASKSEVIISDGEIFYPKATKPDIFLAMSQEACNRYFNDLKPGGVFIIDSTFITNVPTTNAYQIPITEKTIKHLKKPVFANIVALGILCEITKIVSRKSLTKAVLDRVPDAFKEQNKKALQLGFRLGKKESKNTTEQTDFSADE